MTSLPKGVHTGLFVEDITKMVTFYRDILGFDTDWDGGPFASFKVDDGGLFMYDRQQFSETMNQQYHPPKGFNQTMEICINLPTKDDVDTEYKRLITLGVKALLGGPVTQPWEQRNFWIADPEGNYIEIGC